MNKKETRKILSENFEEISFQEYYELDGVGELEITCSDGYLHFKPKQKFPVVFEDDDRKFEVKEDGEIKIINTDDNEDYICVYESLPLLEQAMELSKEIRSKK
jgi:hypothetical protein